MTKFKKNVLIGIILVFSFLAFCTYTSQVVQKVMLPIVSTSSVKPFTDLRLPIYISDAKINYNTQKNMPYGYVSFSLSEEEHDLLNGENSIIARLHSYEEEKGMNYTLKAESVEYDSILSRYKYVAPLTEIAMQNADTADLTMYYTFDAAYNYDYGDVAQSIFWYRSIENFMFSVPVAALRKANDGEAEGNFLPEEQTEIDYILITYSEYDVFGTKYYAAMYPVDILFQDSRRAIIIPYQYQYVYDESAYESGYLTDEETGELVYKKMPVYLNSAGISVVTYSSRPVYPGSEVNLDNML